MTSPAGESQPDVQRLERKIEMLNAMLREAIDAKASAERALLVQEVKYEHLTHHVPWVVLRVRPDGCYADVNLYFAELLGREHRDIVDKMVGSLGEPETWVKAILDASIHQAEVELDGEFGRRRFLLLKFVYRVDGYISVVATDQTERAEALEEAKRQAASAEAANEAKSQFLAVMSHEIRTPLNGVLGMAELLSDTPLDERQSEWLRIILSSGQSLKGLINNILDLTKIEAGGVELELAPFSIADLVGDVLGLFQAQALSKDIRLGAELGHEVPPVVFGDPFRVRQILVNLVSNAIKFTDRGQVVVTTSGQWQGQICQVRFDVQDSGPGIEPDKLEKLFEAFTQADVSTTRRYGGTGLGLNIAKGLAELMGGRLEATSQLGQGACFSLCLGLEEAPSEAQTHLSAGPSRVDLSHLRALVADDNSVNRLVLSSLLGRFGCETVCVENGRLAVDLLAGSDPVHLVLMDMEMPVMDGIEATRAIRTGGGPHQQIPIIAITANAMMSHRELCEEAGMTGFLTKPVSKEQLLKVLLEADLPGIG